MSTVFMFLCRQQKKTTDSLLLGACYLYLKDSRQLTFCVLFKLYSQDKRHWGKKQAMG